MAFRPRLVLFLKRLNRVQNRAMSKYVNFEIYANIIFLQTDCFKFIDLRNTMCKFTVTIIIIIIMCKCKAGFHLSSPPVCVLPWLLDHTLIVKGLEARVAMV